MSTVFLIILAVQLDVMRRKLQSRIPNRFWNLWMLIVDLEFMKRKIGDLGGYDSEEGDGLAVFRSVMKKLL